ncbi:MAG TPA: toll/interleukin-1 receptor domain-containing protein [Steroidobacteraceae bacterium]|nr:toll/interleukin-1 receptor domain-containing protein [Steroidobacteraceae bacterium]
MAREVFVSYSQPDSECAVDMVGRLEREGINCWIAPRDIAPSADWAAEIIDAISNARVMVLVFSASSNDSPQVRREVERAVHKQVSILPFRIENVPLSKSLEYFLSAQHWMDAFPPPRDPYYVRLCAYLKNQLSKPASSRAAAPDIATTQPAPILVSVPPLDTAEVVRAERLLAGYIGPIARHLVKAAAARASSLEELVAQLATELETETDRHEFTQRWRTGSPRR